MSPSRSRRRHPALVPVLIAFVAFAAVACGASGVGDGGPIAARPTDVIPTDPAASGPAASDPGTSPDPSGPVPSDAPSTAPSPSPKSGGSSARPSKAPSATPTVKPPASPSPTASPAGTTTVKVYLLLGEHLVPVARVVPRTQAVARAAIEQLLTGPTNAEATAGVGSTIPDGVLLLGITIRDGLATIDLSREFESGGGTLSMTGRLAQVVYTLTQFPTVDRVAFELDGEPVTVFSGEGIVLDGPSTRNDYVSFLPSIFVDLPAWGGTVGNPARITGISNVFEATFQVRILDAAGRVLIDRHVMATCGTGCWGTFDVTLPYTVARQQVGQVVTYNLSARDGSVEDLRSYPVTLVP
jgi:germination protein M